MFIEPQISVEKLNQISPLAMAYVGDAVYDLAVRSRLVAEQSGKIKEIHQAAVEMVNAQAQAEFLREIENRLTEEERAAVRRGRNAKSHSHPRGVGVVEYRLSTGLETLFGYLFLKGDHERLKEILGWAMS